MGEGRTCCWLPCPALGEGRTALVWVGGCWLLATPSLRCRSGGRSGQGAVRGQSVTLPSRREHQGGWGGTVPLDETIWAAT